MLFTTLIRRTRTNRLRFFLHPLWNVAPRGHSRPPPEHRRLWPRWSTQGWLCSASFLVGFSPPKHAAGSTCISLRPCGGGGGGEKFRFPPQNEGMKTSTGIQSFLLMRRKARDRERTHHGKLRNHRIGPQCTAVLLPPPTVPSCQSPPACPSTSLRCPPK
jgi:hypothetical protein